MIERGVGFFSDFSLELKKSPKSAASPSPRVPARSSSWTPAACGQGVLAHDDDGFFEDDAGNVWTRTSKNTWVDPLGESWLHVRRGSRRGNAEAVGWACRPGQVKDTGVVALWVGSCLAFTAFSRSQLVPSSGGVRVGLCAQSSLRQEWVEVPEQIGVSMQQAA